MVQNPHPAQHTALSPQHAVAHHAPFQHPVSHLQPASAGLKLKKAVGFVLASAFFGALIYLAGWLIEWSWLYVVAYVFTALVSAFGVYIAAVAKVAACPNCGGELGVTGADTLTTKDDDQQLECIHCYDWLISHQGTVRRFGAEDAAKRNEFDAPVFEHGGWPQACVVCGVPPVRVEEVRKTKVELSQLLMGVLSVAQAAIQGVPYCQIHGGSVSVTIKDDHPRLVFDDYGARWRYVAFNRGKRPVKVQG